MEEASESRNSPAVSQAAWFFRTGSGLLSLSSRRLDGPEGYRWAYPCIPGNPSDILPRMACVNNWIEPMKSTTMTVLAQPRGVAELDQASHNTQIVSRNAMPAEKNPR